MKVRRKGLEKMKRRVKKRKEDESYKDRIDRGWKTKEKRESEEIRANEDS